MTGVASFISTPRLTLRPLGPDDAEAIVHGIGNYDVARWLSSVPYPYDPGLARDYLASPIAAPGRAWAICDATGLRGVISLNGELGYWLARDAWGMGYLTEAGDHLVDAWFARRGAAPLVAGYLPGNDRSAHVLTKLGFVQSGVAPTTSRPLAQRLDAPQMVLTRARWQSRRSYRLETPRLTLRSLRLRDWRALQRLGADPRVAPMMASLRTPWPAAEVRDWIRAAPYRGRPGFRLAICRRGQVIGSLGLGPLRAGAAPDLAYFLGPRHWGRGFATEAVGAFVADVMDRFDLPAVTAGHFADNPGSGRVLGKLGFVRTGEEMALSAARLEPARNLLYRLDRNSLRQVP
ncbi:GNAT family N-acetyltransferase [Mesobaculum littorinae]|nr:GNAT family N-acetyltransferase [Mesobaculum littorinae]